jgi:hypothetical protein
MIVLLLIIVLFVFVCYKPSKNNVIENYNDGRNNQMDGIYG